MNDNMVSKIIKSHCKIIFCLSYSETFLVVMAVMLALFLYRLCLWLVLAAVVSALDRRVSNRVRELDHRASAISSGIGNVCLTPFSV